MNIKKIALILLLSIPQPAISATDRFLRGEHAPTLPEGTAEIEAGARYLYSTGKFLALSTEHHRDITDALIIGSNLGVGKRVEIQLEWEAIKLLDDPSLGSFSDVGDLSLFTKLQVMHIPFDTSIRFGVKLPNGSAETHLGTDETDFFASLLFTCTPFKNIRTGLNTGLAILPNPTSAQSQTDKFLYSGIVEWIPNDTWHIATEVWGLTSFKNKPFEEATIRSGVVYIIKKISLDAAASYGFGPYNEGWGITGGAKLTLPQVF